MRPGSWALPTVMSVALACGSVRPQVTRYAPFPTDTDPTIFVISATHKPAAIDALRRTRFEIVDNLAHAEFVARVTVGVDKSFGSCGTLNNVKLALSSREQQLLEIQARGWTGTCQPNVFDQVADALRQEFPRRAGRPEPAEGVVR